MGTVTKFDLKINVKMFAVCSNTTKNVVYYLGDRYKIKYLYFTTISDIRAYFSEFQYVNNDCCQKLLVRNYLSKF